MQELKSLRQHLRQQRLALNTEQLAIAAESAAARIFTQPWFMRAHSIAAYIPANGELDPYPVMQKAAQMEKKFYLPALRPIGHNRLWFIRWQKDQKLVVNRFGIQEPEIKHGNIKAPWSLDVVITPLLGFDVYGNRLGMGGGYYDRSFAYRLIRKRWKKPLLVGYAHEFQKLEQLTADAWDVPLDLIVTDKNIYWPGKL